MAKVLNPVITILQQRDGMRQEEAVDFFRSTMSEVYAAIESGDYVLAEDIFQSDFGLEIDYLLEVII